MWCRGSCAGHGDGGLCCCHRRTWQPGILWGEHDLVETGQRHRPRPLKIISTSEIFFSYPASVSAARSVSPAKGLPVHQVEEDRAVDVRCRKATSPNPLSTAGQSYSAAIDTPPAPRPPGNTSVTCMDALSGKRKSGGMCVIK